MLVTLEDAKTHLRIDHDADDAFLTKLIASAVAIAVNFTGDPAILTLDPVPEDLRLAILTGVANAYDHMGGGTFAPTEAMAPLLTPYRVWAF
ncbi:head-tail connector protein [Acuticoccus yangtzensis]|uniref:head-tail connector protein n=1 Tax=Acuticoccus yangtzensis TaxID=1443441 RepID=UPI0009497B05|nr:head-tail connector protein [Acuticoccus yangtzensis]